MIILQNSQYGILLSYDCYDKIGKRILSNYYSVGDPTKMDLIEDVGDEEFFPIGSFLEPKHAWLAIEDFFNHPIKISDRIEWIAADQIEWPED